MQSTFKREYDKETLADGSVQLSFKESRVGAHQGALMARFLVVYIVFFLFALGFMTFLLTFVLGEHNIGLAFVISLGLVCYGVFRISRKLVFKRSSIVIKKEGIIFEKQGGTIFNTGHHQLAFRDVADFGITTESSSGDNGAFSQTSYLYANAGGQKIRITKHMTQALAEALWGEINSVAKG
jgi:hypothetical protein